MSEDYMSEEALDALPEDQAVAYLVSIGYDEREARQYLAVERGTEDPHDVVDIKQAPLSDAKVQQ